MHRVKNRAHFNGWLRWLFTSWAFLWPIFFLVAQEPGPALVSRVTLTEAERVWIAAHPRIRVGYDADWPPFSFQKTNGEFSGIDADIPSFPAGTWLQVSLGGKIETLDR